ncbi:energy transducer TonB [Flavivirga eckloniae]|uniref:Energy transducer TonB n=1 Tax=Flavivirga eckloniae TaxID=1803846 RepID=A0A2K9PP82_9FLAO|nr:energy transducer TonB [Flavivirga eckloniae]AUP78890.1 energy transducer TonB [Flavivirga eckloniae]
MRNQKKSHELIRQNEEIVKKSQKHDANLQKNSTLYFQVGLIICLLAVYGLFEMKFETKISTYAGNLPLEDPYTIEIPVIKPEVQAVKETVKRKRIENPKKFIEVPNDEPINPIIDEPVEPIVNNGAPINPEDINLPVIDEEVFIPVDFVQVVPIFPGCEKKKSNPERRKCMTKELNKLIKNKFDRDLGREFGLKGKQVIRTQFKIDKTGKVTDVRVRGSHPALEKEAERVINIIPKMTPAKQQKENVGVMYTLPIVFQVE